MFAFSSLLPFSLLFLLSSLYLSPFLPLPPPSSLLPPLQNWFAHRCSGMGVWPPQRPKSVTPAGGSFSSHEAQTDHLKQQENWSSLADKSLNHPTYSPQATGTYAYPPLCVCHCGQCVATGPDPFSPNLVPLTRRNGEPSRISWASARFCDKCNLAMVKTFCSQPAQKRYRYLNGDEQILLL